MATSGVGFSMSSLRPVLPVFAGMMGSLGLMAGLYSFSDPAGATKQFGLQHEESSSQAQGFQAAMSQAIGIRNISGGITILSILATWQFSTLCQVSPVAVQTVKRVLGITFTTGVLTSFGDAYILSQYAKVNGISSEAKQLAEAQSKGHFSLGIPIFCMGLAFLYTST